MSRNEYMDEMRYYLRRLPKADFEKAIEYFEEYFEEAGPDMEQKAAEDLGAPEMAADQIIRDLAMKNADNPQKSIKSGVSAVWVGILAVFAAPVGIPMAFALGALILAFALTIFCLVLAVCATSFLLVAAAVPLSGISIWLLFTSPFNGLASLGTCLITIGVGIWLVKGCIWLSRWFSNQMTKLFGKMAKKGERYEKEK